MDELQHISKFDLQQLLRKDKETQENVKALNENKFGNGLVTSDNVTSVKGGNCIIVDGNGVNVLTKLNGGIVADENGSGLMLKLKIGGGLAIDENGELYIMK